MNLTKGLTEHVYIRLHLVLYALRVSGLLHHRDPPYATVLMVFVKMVPLANRTRPPRRRISITNLVSVPLATLEQDVITSYEEEMRRIRATEPPSARGVAIMVIPTLQADRRAVKARMTFFTLPVQQELLLLARQTAFDMSLESHSFGATRKLTSDLDALYW